MIIFRLIHQIAKEIDGFVFIFTQFALYLYEHVLLLSSEKYKKKKRNKLEHATLL